LEKRVWVGRGGRARSRDGEVVDDFDVRVTEATDSGDEAFGTRVEDFGEEGFVRGEGEGLGLVEAGRGWGGSVG
jgi:hypothetical protein